MAGARAGAPAYAWTMPHEIAADGMCVLLVANSSTRIAQLEHIDPQPSVAVDL